jgi:hypothetical protein
LDAKGWVVLMINKLLKIIKEELKESKIKLYLGKGKYLKYSPGIKVNGFFDYENSKLAVATKKPNWELTLVHEYSHFKQWKEQCREWQDYVGTPPVIDKPVEGFEVDIKELNYSAKVTMMMERDCEIRAHNLLKKFGYPKDKLVEYIQKANAYALFYLFLAKHRKWYVIGKEPYVLPNVWKKFPKTFSIDLNKTYDKLEYLYFDCTEK